MGEKSKITVVLHSGQTFEYETDAWKAREHTHAIIQNGYRSVRDGILTHYTPSAISKVTATNQETKYEDKVSGT